MRNMFTFYSEGHQRRFKRALLLVFIWVSCMRLEPIITMVATLSILAVALVLAFLYVITE